LYMSVFRWTNNASAAFVIFILFSQYAMKLVFNSSNCFSSVSGVSSNNILFIKLASILVGINDVTISQSYKLNICSFSVDIIFCLSGLTASLYDECNV